MFNVRQEVISGNENYLYRVLLLKKRIYSAQITTPLMNINKYSI